MVHKPTKFPWRMMCINMSEVRVIVEFFRRNVEKFRRGAHVLLERIEDFSAVNDYEEEKQDQYPDTSLAEYKGAGGFEGGGDPASDFNVIN